MVLYQHVQSLLIVRFYCKKINTMMSWKTWGNKQIWTRLNFKYVKINSPSCLFEIKTSFIIIIARLYFLYLFSRIYYSVLTYIFLYFVLLFSPPFNNMFIKHLTSSYVVDKKIYSSKRTETYYLCHKYLG